MIDQGMMRQDNGGQLRSRMARVWVASLFLVHGYLPAAAQLDPCQGLEASRGQSLEQVGQRRAAIEEYLRANGDPRIALEVFFYPGTPDMGERFLLAAEPLEGDLAHLLVIKPSRDLFPAPSHGRGAPLRLKVRVFPVKRDFLDQLSSYVRSKMRTVGYPSEEVYWLHSSSSITLVDRSGNSGDRCGHLSSTALDRSMSAIFEDLMFRLEETPSRERGKLLANVQARIATAAKGVEEP